MITRMQGMSASFAPSFEAAMEEPSGQVVQPTPEPTGAGQPNGASEPSGGAPTPSPSSSSQPTPSEQLLELKVGGKTEKLPVAEVIARAQRDSDYTLKTQKLAEERKRWESDRETILRQERERWNREQQELARRKETEGLEPGQRALIEARAVRDMVADQQLESTLRAIRKAHPDLEESTLLIEGQKRGLRKYEDLETLADELSKTQASKFDERFNSRFDEILAKREDPRVKKLQDEIINAYLAGKIAKPAPVTNAGGSTPALGTQPVRRAKSLDEASDMAMELLGHKPGA